MRDFDALHLELISSGYPKPSKLQAEQLKLVQLLQFAIHHFQVAVVREDLAHQMFLYTTVNSVLESLRLLSQLSYVTRVQSYYGS